MPRRALVAAALAVLIAFGGGLPGWVAPTAAASCSSWASEVDPPPTIRVYRHLSGAVETVDFRAYTQNVLSREWIGSWTAESLRSGALAVKHYAWYQVLHWRGGVNPAGECFDLRDDTSDQVYDPSKPTWGTAAAAVDATWTTRVMKNGAIFPTYYNAGALNEACGANANGWKMYQWGTQGCGLAGKTAAEIVLLYYYPGVTVTEAPAPAATPTPSSTASPTPSPSASETPTPTETPAETPTETPAETPTETPAATATPTPTPTATPLPIPPPTQQLPGGGQAGVEGLDAPPPAPPPDPIAVAEQAGLIVATDVIGFAWPYHAATDIAGFLIDDSGDATATTLAAGEVTDPRLTSFRLLWGAATQRLVTALIHGLAADGGLALRLLPPGS